MQPDLILIPFAEDALAGNIDSIPESLGPSDPPQAASWRQGFPQVTMTPLAAGGIPPRGQSFNGVLHDISEHLVYIGGGGQYLFSPEFVAEKGGYAIGAVLQSNDGKTSYRSAINLNTKNFNTDPASIGAEWIPYAGEGISPVQATETIAGIAEVATQSEVTAGTSDLVMLTPKKLAGASTANATDSTTGKLLRVGDFGFGAPSASPDAPNLNNITAGGFYSYTAAATNAPLAAIGALIVIAQSGATTQLAIDRASQRSFVRTITSSGPVTWSAWREVGISSLATTAVAGIVQLATSAQMQTGSSTSLVPPVSAIMSLFSKRVFAANDFIRLPDVPGGLVIQFGVVAVPAYSDGTTFSGTWSTPFTTACLGMCITPIGAVNILRQGSTSLTGFTAGTATRDQSGSSSLSSAFFISIGY